MESGHSVELYFLRPFSIVTDGEPRDFTGRSLRKPLELLKLLVALGGEGVPTEPLPAFPNQSSRGPRTGKPLWLQHARMSRPRIAAPRLAASRRGRQQQRAEDAAIAASERQLPAEALACPGGVFKGCAPEGTALK
jgi:hypothetical protein